MKPLSPSVAHLVQVYYALSENWIRTQIIHLHRYTPFVLSRRTQNLDSTESPPLYALLERPRVEKLFNLAAEKFLGYPPSFLRMLQKRDAHLIHAHFGPKGYAAIPLAKAAGLPLVTTFYGYDLTRLLTKKPEWKSRYDELFHFGSRFLVEGRHMQQQLIALGCPARKTRVQHLGVDLAHFPYQPRHLRTRTPLQVLAAGRFEEKKGFSYALEAFAHFLAEGGKGTLTLIGDAKPDDPEQQQTKQDLLATIRKYGLEATVHLRGMVPHGQLIKAYYEHHAFLSPSVVASNGDNEGGAPVTLIEASATGMPIVSSLHCDIPEVVVHGQTGFLAPERDVECLAEHLLTLFRRPTRVQDMGRRAHGHIAEEYNAQRQGEKLEAIYDAVL